MDDCKAGIQYVFQTKNTMTLALSSTGHSGMECVMTNLIEKGDKVLIANNGIWGERAMDMARRQGIVLNMLFQLEKYLLSTIKNCWVVSIRVLNSYCFV